MYYVYKMALISTRIPEDLEKEIRILGRRWRAERSEIIRRLLDKAIKDFKLQNALEQLTLHKISLGKAAEEVGISIWEMLEIVKEKKIDWVGLTPEEVEKDFEMAKGLFKK